VGKQEAFAPVQPEQVGVPVLILWLGSYKLLGTNSDKVEHLFRAAKDHELDHLSRLATGPALVYRAVRRQG
jgi:hypothetical protein